MIFERSLKLPFPTLCWSV